MGSVAVADMARTGEQGGGRQLLGGSYEDYIGTALLVVTLRHAPVTGFAARIYIWDAIRSIADTTRSSSTLPVRPSVGPASVHVQPACIWAAWYALVRYHKVNGPVIAR